MKRVAIALCTFALLASVGCGKDDNNTNNTNGNNTTGNNTTGNNTTGNNTTGNNTTGNNTTGNNTTGNNTTGNNTTGTNNPPGGATYCRLECATAADCGDETMFDCTDSRCVFTGEAQGCTEDDECVSQFSGWITECQTDGDCVGQVCIDIGDADAGRCATEPGAVDCATLTLEDFDTTKFEDDSAVTVCANTSASCHDDGYCFVPCVDDSTCGDLVCDTDSGTCICESDANCTTDGSDKCYDGVCGCAAEASCDPLEAGGASYVCE